MIEYIYYYCCSSLVIGISQNLSFIEWRFYTTLLVASSKMSMSLGNLQAEVLGSLHKLGRASVREVMADIGEKRELAYTTVSTVLDRLYAKGLVKRTTAAGPGGTRYVYSYAAPPEMSTSVVNKTINRLVSAFGPNIVPTIYNSLEQISKKESDGLKRKIAARRR